MLVPVTHRYIPNVKSLSATGKIYIRLAEQHRCHASQLFPTGKFRIFALFSAKKAPKF
jgi:hypothetical protein